MTTTIGELIDNGVISVATGFASGEHNQEGVGIPHMRPYNVTTDGRVSLAQIKSVPIPKHSARLLAPGDILFNNTNTAELVGKTAYWARVETYAFSNHMTRIRVLDADQVVPRYLSFALHREWAVGQAQQLCRQHVAQASIIGERFRELKLEVPEPRLQRNIAAVLALVQRAMENQEKVIAAARELKQVALNCVFSTDPKGVTWVSARLDSWCKVASSSISYTDFASRSPSDVIEGVRVMGIKVSDMNLPGNELEMVTANLEGSLSTNEARRRTVSPNAVVFPKRGAAIATNKKRLTTTWTVLDPNLIAVEPGPGVDAEFLFQWFQHFDLRSITEPGPTPQLNKKNLDPLIINLPKDVDEQRRIAHDLSTIDQAVLTGERRAAKLRELFASLLDKLMSGALRVRNIDIDASNIAVA